MQFWRALPFTALLFAQTAFSWNAVGHRLIAQIAYDNLMHQSKNTLNRCNKTIDHACTAKKFINSSVWLDSIRIKTHAYDAMHYIDIPFSTDGTTLPSIPPVNAVWAIERSMTVLSNSRMNSSKKKTALRILVHVVGDIHQPLHAATRVSRSYPEGDRGGNLVVLHKNKIAKNLHSFWDKGAGLFAGKRRYGQAWIKQKASAIEQDWPCNMEHVDLNAMHWAQESNLLVQNGVYALSYNNTLDERYQYTAQKTVEQRIALAGCRLAGLMNKME